MKYHENNESENINQEIMKMNKRESAKAAANERKSERNEI